MFLERWLWQIFGENIGGLLSSPDIRHSDDTFAVLFTHIMLTQLDMLVSAADYWIVHHGNTRFVVFEHQSRFWLLESGYLARQSAAPALAPFEARGALNRLAGKPAPG